MSKYTRRRGKKEAAKGQELLPRAWAVGRGNRPRTQARENDVGKTDANAQVLLET